MTGRGGKSMKARGFTLIEVLMSVSITTVLMGAIGSVFIIASKALPSAANPAESTAGAALVLDRMSVDLADATAMSGGGATSLTLTVGDRDGDSKDDTVCYAWSGKVGDPLTISLNGTRPVTIAQNVRAFSLAYNTVTWTDNNPVATASDAAALLSGQANSSQKFDITTTAWCGQSVQPTLPATAWSWTPTGAKIKLRTSGSADVGSYVGVRLYAADSTGKPTGAMIDEAQIAETAMDSIMRWYSFTFTKGQPIAAGQAVCLVVASAAGSGPGRASYDDSAAPPAGTFMVQTSNGGATWSTVGASTSLTYELWGTVEHQAPAVVGRTHVERVKMTLQIDSDKSTVARASAALRNVPEVK